MSLASTLLALGGLFTIAVVVLVLHVDDWGRDLSTNVAETSHHATDPLLRPLTASLPPDELARRVREAAVVLPRWQFEREVTEDSGLRLDFVRTTRLFRFRDDIAVWILDAGEERTIRARSASRLGGADLGQNPRNLRMLMRELGGRLP
jgi:uncharacterized protein (DUF1499 family)